MCGSLCRCVDCKNNARDIEKAKSLAGSDGKKTVKRTEHDTVPVSDKINGSLDGISDAVSNVDQVAGDQ